MKLQNQIEAANFHSGALNDRVYDYIIGQILVGAFVVNSRLPTEMQLAERLSVSRPVVRQALRRLRADGIVKSRQGAGTFVIRRPAHEIFSFAEVGSVADIQKCFAFRIALEGEAAALAASEHDEATLDHLKKSVDALERSLADGVDGVEEDIAFHQAVAAATDNRFFLSSMTALSSQIRVGIGLNRSLTLNQPAARSAAVQREHRDIFDAISRRDSAAARDAMQRHLENARLRIFEGGEY